MWYEVVPLVERDASRLSCPLGCAMEKRARSWVSMSLISAVMSCERSNAFVKIFGGGKLPSSITFAPYRDYNKITVTPQSMKRMLIFVRGVC